MIKCLACRTYQRLCSYVTIDENSLVHPLILLTNPFLDRTKAFYQLGAIISCIVPSDLRRGLVLT